MTTKRSILAQRRGPAIALALLLAATAAACAQMPSDPPGSGSSVPGQIDYHGGPYNIQAG
jgi:opacity protein-like surface antigen